MDVEGLEGWSGFMERATRNIPYCKSFISCLPFINAPPSNYDTIIYTALLSAVEKMFFVITDQEDTLPSGISQKRRREKC